MNPRDLLDWLRPPELLDDTGSEAQRAKYRQAVNRWRWNVCLSFLAVFLFCTWSFTKWGFARASDIDHRVQQALEPIQAEITTIKDAQAKQGEQLDKQNQILTRLSEQLTEQLIASTASQIRLLIAKRCKELPGSAERERINRELEKLQLLYKDRTGDRLQIACDEL